MPYVGGKNRLAKWIIGYIPPHVTYAEIFGGSSGVLLNKGRSKLEVYNDKWDDVVHLFYMLRDRGTEMKEYLKYLPLSRTIFEELWMKVMLTRDFKDDIERAASVFYCLNVCYSGILELGWETRREKNSALPMKNRVNNLEFFVDRLREVVIENLDFEKCIKDYDAERTFFYCDPPYLFPNKRPNYYQRDFIFRDHYRLAKQLNNIKGKVAVSYYPTDEVFELYPKEKWFYVEKEIVKQTATVAKGKKKPTGTELLIMNYDPQEIQSISTTKNLQEVFA